jgi:branched-chain amino acid transport system substrate-binding protein
MKERSHTLRSGILFFTLFAFFFLLSTGAWAEEKIIKFGCSISLTGPLSREGYGCRDGLELWKWWVNEKLGGINIKGVKYKVDIKYYDDESNPVRTVKLTEKLITDDGIRLLFSPYSSGMVFAGSAASEKYKALMGNVGGTAEEIFGRGFRYIVTATGTSTLYFKGVLDLAAKQNPKPQGVAMVYENDIFARDAVEGAVDKCKELGFKVVFNQVYPKGTKDISTPLTQIKALKPDILLVGGHYTDSVLAVQQTKDLKVNVKLFSCLVGVPVPEFVKALGKDAENVVGMGWWTPEVNYKDPVWGSGETFTKEFIKKFKYTPDYHNFDGAIGAELLQMGIEKAQSTDPTEIRNALDGFEVPSSIGGPIKLDKRGVNVLAQTVVLQIQNGKAVSIYPKEVAASKIIYPKHPWE